MAGVADGNGRLDDDRRLFLLGGGGFLDQGQHAFDGGAVKKVLLGVVVGGGGDDDEVGFGIGAGAVCRGGQVEGALAGFGFVQEFLDVFVLDGGDKAVEFLDLFGDDVHSCHLVVLGK